MNDFLDDEFEYPVITFTVDGEEKEFMIIDEVTDKGNKYILAVECEEIDDENAEAWIFKEVGSDGEEAVYEIIENEAELEGVMYLFNESSEDYDLGY